MNKRPDCTVKSVFFGPILCDCRDDLYQSEAFILMGSLGGIQWLLSTFRDTKYSSSIVVVAW